MSTDHRELLKNIRTFPSLIKYLRDELDWPISSGDFEELTFDYTPEELGIDTKNAAKIQEIKRLRPLAATQPWGIFFVKFEPKRLPVVALRRILSRVVVKKRASANSAERAAWQMDDLLFVSNYGEGEERRINLAHFTQENQSNLPTLKVLGWDNLDTPLHLDHVGDELNEKLTWPEDEGDLEAWRETWRSAFTLRHREVITTSKSLASKLAELARGIRNRIDSVLAIETEDGSVTKLMKAFQEALIHDLNEDSFADMYAQTIAYGLLSARIANPGGSTTNDIATQLPVANPFLKELMETFIDAGGRNRGGRSKAGIDFDELGIGEVVELLDDANMEAVIRDFGDRNPQEDPVIHFYELFLQEYDADQKARRGVFYTPRPVVSFIVRSVDEQLRTEFKLEDGLADTTNWETMAEQFKDIKIPDSVLPEDPFVQILDPATGTGTFLVEVIDVIHRTMVEKWKSNGHSEMEVSQLWNSYVPKNLIPRLFGYELLMAPYAIAHMKISLKLFETGYRFGNNERTHIYLTNSLEPAQDFSDHLEFAIPALAHEAEAVNDIKRNKRFTVIIGNPPYSALSANMTEEARKLTKKFKFIDGVKVKERGALQLEKNLQDDYIKFIALIENLLNSSKTGLCGIICNHGFIDNPTLRGVRWSLLNCYNRIWILDLHGNVNRGEKSPDGSDDQNVFDIKDAGVAVLIGLIKGEDEGTINEILKGDLWGNRNTIKYPFLISKTINSSSWEIVRTEPKFFLFRSFSTEGVREYTSWMQVTDVFPLYSIGIITARDFYVIDFEPEPLIQRAKAFRDSQLDDESTCRELGIPLKKGWNISNARKRIKEVKDLTSYIHPLLYRPFDIRPTFYHESLIWGMAKPVMQHMLRDSNLALITSRMTKGESFRHVFVSKNISEVILLSSKTSNNAFVFPLHLETSESELQLGEYNNLSSQFLSDLAESLDIPQETSTGIPSGLTPEVIFKYIYAILHSPDYRIRYDALLKIDFPRIPLTRSLELFRSMAKLGDKLIALHLMVSPKLEEHITTVIGSGDFEVEKVFYKDGTVWLDKVKTHGFHGVPEEVWNFHVGGYQVCHKWLKDRQAKGGKNPRPGRVLTDEDIDHYQKIVVTLNETIRIMKEIDEVIEEHGGWPDAFALGDMAEEVSDEKVIPFPQPGETDEAEPQPLRKVAETGEKYRTKDTD